LRAGQTQILAKHFQERLVRRKRDFHLFPIDSQHQVRLLELVLCPVPNLFHELPLADTIWHPDSAGQVVKGKEPQEAQQGCIFEFCGKNFLAAERRKSLATAAGRGWVCKKATSRGSGERFFRRYRGLRAP